MSNPLYQALNRSENNMPTNLIEQFNQFMKEMNGKNPNEEINKLLMSGKINQNQLNEAQRMAQQFQTMLKHIK